jgi:dihydrofolate reductase
MKLSLIAAVARNGVIGDGDKMPWHLPADLRYFKVMTQGKIVIMGRKTFESIGRALPLRHNIILSRQPEAQSADAPLQANSPAYWAQDLSQAFRLCEDLLARSSEVQPPITSDEVMVIGGGQLYATLLPASTRMYITQVNTLAEGQARFPEWTDREWSCTRTDARLADAQNPLDCNFQIFDRVANGLSYRDLMEGQHQHV